MSIVDSAGVSIVTSEVAGLPVSGVDPQPEVSIGSLDGGEQSLFRVRSIDRLSDGRWVITNAGTSEVRIFSSEGAFERAIGREGEGPGEFASLSSARVIPGDSIEVWDSRARRMSIFLADGTLVRDFTPPVPEGEVPASLIGRLVDGRYLGSTGTRFAGDMSGSRVLRPDTRRVLLDSAGAELREIWEGPGSEQWLTVGDGFISIRSIPFAKGSASAVSTDRIFLAQTETPQVRVYDDDGRLVEIRRMNFTPPEVTAAEWARVEEKELDAYSDPEILTSTREFFEEVPRPDRHPAHGTMLVTTDGHLWVQRFSSPAGDELNRWWRFDDDGAVVDELELPVGFTPRWSDGRRVAGTVTDDFDVEYVRIHTIEGV